MCLLRHALSPNLPNDVCIKLHIWACRPCIVFKDQRGTGRHRCALPDCMRGALCSAWSMPNQSSPESEETSGSLGSLNFEGRPAMCSLEPLHPPA